MNMSARMNIRQLRAGYQSTLNIFFLSFISIIFYEYCLSATILGTHSMNMVTTYVTMTESNRMKVTAMCVLYFMSTSFPDRLG